jgi:hypothetical protein
LEHGESVVGGDWFCHQIANQSPIARAWRALKHALDDRIKQAAIAA